MELKNICTDINSKESIAAGRTSHFLLASLVIYAGLLLVKRFNLRWYRLRQ